jgi:protein-tyrosine phosphatase
MAGFRILTVCTGNLHRSAFAAELLRAWTRWYLPEEAAREVDVASAGTHAAVGRPMDPVVRRMLAALIDAGEGHRARQLQDAHIAEADLVLTASRRHRDDVLARVPSAMRRTFTIREAGRIAAQVECAPPRDVTALTAAVDALADRRHQSAADLTADDIADPQGRGVEGFARMAVEELPALVALGGTLFNIPRPDADAYLAAATDPVTLGLVENER